MPRLSFPCYLPISQKFVHSFYLFGMETNVNTAIKQLVSTVFPFFCSVFLIFMVLSLEVGLKGQHFWLQRNNRFLSVHPPLKSTYSKNVVEMQQSCKLRLTNYLN